MINLNLSTTEIKELGEYHQQATIDNFFERLSNKGVELNYERYTHDWREKKILINEMRKIRIKSSESMVDSDEKKMLDNIIFNRLQNSRETITQMQKQPIFYSQSYDKNYINTRISNFNTNIHKNAFEIFSIQLLDQLSSGLFYSQVTLLDTTAKAVNWTGGRGCGKTEALNRKATITCLMESNTVVVITNLKEDQVKGQNFDPIIKMIKNCIGQKGYDAIIQHVSTSKHLLKIDFNNGSAICFVSAKSGGGVGDQYRGKTVKLFIWDESSFAGGDFNQVITAAAPAQRNIRYGDVPQVICCSSMNIKQEGVMSKSLITHQWNLREQEQYKIILNLLHSAKLPADIIKNIIEEFKRYGISKTFLNIKDDNGIPLYKSLNTNKTYILINGILLPLFNYWFGAVNYCKIVAQSIQNSIAFDAVTEHHQRNIMPESGLKIELENDASSLVSRNLWTSEELDDIRITFNSDCINVARKMAEKGFLLIMSIDPNGVTSAGAKDKTGNSDLGAVLLAVDMTKKFVFVLKDYTVYSSINKNVNSDLVRLFDKMENDGLFSVVETDFGKRKTVLENIVYENNNTGARVALESYIKNSITSNPGIHNIIKYEDRSNPMNNFIQYVTSGKITNDKNEVSKSKHTYQSKINRMQILQNTYGEKRTFHCHFLKPASYTSQLSKLENQMLEFTTDPNDFKAKIRQDPPITFDALDAMSQTLVSYFQKKSISGRVKTKLFNYLFGSADSVTQEINIDSIKSFYDAKNEYKNMFSDEESELVYGENLKEDECDY